MPRFVKSIVGSLLIFGLFIALQTSSVIAAQAEIPTKEVTQNQLKALQQELVEFN